MFRSRLSTVATVSVFVLVIALAFQVRSLVTTLSEPLTYSDEHETSEVVSLDDLVWQQEMLLLGLSTSSDPSASSESDQIAMIGPVVVAQLMGQYAGLVESGNYSPEVASQVAESIAPNVRAAVSYRVYTAADIKTKADTSYESMLAYRANLREALDPLMSDVRPELETYALFVDTGDASYLDELSSAAQNYRAAAENVVNITIPRDALIYHLNILNALEQFAATLNAMARYDQDPFASVALLRTYNSAEEEMFTSFDALGEYYKKKLP